MNAKQFQHTPCPVCQGAVIGRSDKRYCSVQCKNAHHLAARKINRPMTEEQNRRLLRNLTLLEGIMGNDGKTLRIHKDELIRRGFDPDSVTGLKFRKNGYRLYCYHFSFTISADGILHVIRHDKVAEELPGFYERWTIDYPENGKVNRRERRRKERQKRFSQRE